MRYLTFVVLISAFLIGSMTAAPANASQRGRTCSYQGLDRGRWTDHEVRATIRCAVRHWHVNEHIAMCVARAESGFFYKAHSPTNDLGVYQHHAPYWPGRQNKFDRHRPLLRNIKESPYNARSNVLVAIRMAHAGGWGPWRADPCV